LNELIKINRRNIGDGEVPTVSARELHGFLGSKRQFSNWIIYQINAFRFIEGVDFIKLNNFVSSDSKPITEYHLTIDMAKELSMVERNEKGRQARQYFIACEKKAKQAPVDMLADPHAMRSLLLSYTEKVIELQDTINEIQPLADAHKRYGYADGLTCMTNAAKDLQVQPQALIRFMSKSRWIYKRAGSKTWTAYQDKIQQGLMSHKSTTVTTSDGREKTVDQALLTAKGIAKLSILLNPPVKKEC